jgi:hypothetical protein
LESDVASEVVLYGPEDFTEGVYRRRLPRGGGGGEVRGGRERKGRGKREERDT